MPTTRLATAITGISAAGDLETSKHDDTSRRGVGDIDKKVSKAISSAAALVATVCTEAAESFLVQAEGTQLSALALALVLQLIFLL